MRKNKFFEKHESGRSMVEIVGVLAVMGLITAGAFVLVRSGTAAQKRSRAVDEVSVIAENVRGLYADSEGFSELTDNTTDGTTLIDALYLNTITPFGQDTVYSVVKNSSDNSKFYVKMIGLEQEDCKALAATAWPNSHGQAVCADGVVSILFAK